MVDRDFRIGARGRGSGVLLRTDTQGRVIMSGIRSRVVMILVVVALAASWSGAATGKKYVGLADYVPDGAPDY